MQEIPNEKNRIKIQDFLERSQVYKSRNANLKNMRENAESFIAKAYYELFVDQTNEAIKVLNDNRFEFIEEEKALDDDEKQKIKYDEILTTIKNKTIYIAQNAASSTIKSVINEQGKVADESFNVNFILPNLTEDNTDRLEALKAKELDRQRSILKERGLKTFASVSKTNTEAIMARIQEGIEFKKTVQQISSSLLALISDNYKDNYRTKTIARTEVATASSIAQSAAMKVQSKYVKNLKKAWITAGDIRVRGNPQGAPSKYNHYILQGEVRNWNKPFSNGLMYPHDPKGEPGDVINCRCELITISGDDAELIGLNELSETLPKD